MKGIAALLAAALLVAGAAGCGEDDGAEPGAPIGAALILDFTPNAVHAGIFAAERQGFYRDEGIDLTVREPGESSDAPKLLAAGKVDFAVMDVHDLGIAREQGLDLVGVMPIVEAPLAAVIARAEGPVKRPRDLGDGHSVGVTGLPSDEAVVDSEVAADGGDPAGVDRVTIGFNAISTLAAAKVDAATGFWNAEGVALRRQGVPIRIFKVDEYGAPAYPELVIATTGKTFESRPELVARMLAATAHGYELARAEPDLALDDLLAAEPALDRAEQAAQMRAVRPIFVSAPAFRLPLMRRWSQWDVEHGLLKRPVDVGAAFPPVPTR
jgi:NitT/TauT family transport system substrate-binding protein/putative hydroxymethylpyrimidine transport system substrate-binding protein